MICQRRAAQILKTEVPRMYRALQQAYGKGLLVGREFDYLLERLIGAEASKDSMLCLPSLRVTPLTTFSHRTAEDTVRFRGPLGEVLSSDRAKDEKIGQC